MPYSSYPKVANTDYSPSQEILAYQEPFNKSYLTSDYTTSPDYSLSTVLDTDSFFDLPLTSVEGMSPGFHTKPSPFNPTLPATGISATNNQLAFNQQYYPTPFEQLDQQISGYSLDPASINSIEPNSFSPITQTSSRTPSLCGDAQQLAHSPSLSPRLIKRESPFSPGLSEAQNASQRPVRKRGRPRLDRFDTSTEPNGPSSAKCPRTGRLPHNQVERKYREGLNSELERLRKAVPTLPQSDEGGVMGQPKPSKAMVLSSAIEYIKSIEKERDALKEEVERLKQSQIQTISWNREQDSLDEFLMDP